MSYKWPWTNYHELNLTWVLEQLKDLISKSKENVETVESYEGRLTAVETELPLVSETADAAQQTASAAATLAQTASNKADAAQDNAISASTAAGVAQQTAQQASADAAAATQAAQQAQQIAQNFDGRITQAENDASAALEASRSFENRVNAAITTANNAASVATNAQGIASDANMKSAQALDELNRQRETLEDIVDDGKAELDTAATEAIADVQAVIDTIPADYTALAELVDKKAPVIINTASGAVASFNDGADDMLIESLLVDITPIQAGSGEPSPDNIRPIGGWTGAEVTRDGKNLIGLNTSPEQEIAYNGVSASDVSNNSVTLTSTTTGAWRNMSLKYKLKAGTYTLSIKATSSDEFTPIVTGYKGSSAIIQNVSQSTPHSFTLSEEAVIEFRFFVSGNPGAIRTVRYYDVQLELGSTATDYEPYTGSDISISWETEAGTVYGGTLTLNPDRTGKLTNNHRLDVFNGNYTFSLASETDDYLMCTAYLREAAARTYNQVYAMSNWAKFYNGYLAGTITFRFALADDNRALYVWVPKTIMTTVTEFNQFVIDNPLQILYTTFRTYDYQLTAEQVSGILSTLYGVNNIWSNTGDTEVTYPADTKLYIDNKFTELQALILEH